MSIFIIFSGGQTGVDRAALDAAIECNIPHGGWCPKNRTAEDGRINKKYNLKETNSKSYSKRTKKNIEDSDATLIVYNKLLRGGTLLTYKYACQINKPVYLFDISEESNTSQIDDWLQDYSVNILNVAGPRESQNEGIYKSAKNILTQIFERESQKLKT